MSEDHAAERRAGAVLTVDLDAIVGNWRSIGARLPPGCRAAAVVKADGYGLGMVPLARALRRAGCRRFFVATLDEGMALRDALDDAEIVILNGLDGEFAGEYRHHRLIPMLNSLDQADSWRRVAADCRQRLAAVLQIDSGMSRLGLSLAEAKRLADDRDFGAAVDLMLVISHLACADEPDHPLNRQQLRVFAAARALFPASQGSLAASSGIFLGPEFHADWVRPGAALYGINPTRRTTNPMAPAVKLQTRILQVRDIDEGMTVGYGATHRATGKARLAIVAAGYADGLLRALSNRGHGHIGDKRVPLVGRVSMDLTIFDVTGVAEAEIVPGALIDLIGPLSSVDDVAAAAGTIGYEILTALGPRIHRRYSAGGTR